MSYIDSGDALADFNQAVISFWFRVPQESMEKAAAAYTGEEGIILDGIVPLVVMGQKGTGATPTTTTTKHGVLVSTSGGATYQGGLYDIQAECIETVEILPGVICCAASTVTQYFYCTATGGPSENRTGTTTSTTVAGDPKPTDPTFIGVDQSGRLVINFESTTKADVTGSSDVVGIIPGTSGGGSSGGCIEGTKSLSGKTLSCFAPIIAWEPGSEYNAVDNTTTKGDPGGGGTPSEEPQYICADNPYAGDATGSIYSSEIQVSADSWHHVLISVDLGAVNSHGRALNQPFTEVGDYVDSAARLFVALDNKNYTKDELSKFWVRGKGNNDVITADAYDIAVAVGNECGIPTYSLNMTAVPQGTIGIPATAEYVDNIYHIEMAEFQMWTGVTLDTGIEANRRAFIDYERNAQGAIIPDALLKPVNPEVAEELIGKPNILFHGSSRWKEGDNTGLLSDFQPTGIIGTYHPDPSIPS